MTGLTLTGNQLILSILILGIFVAMAILILRQILKYKLIKSKAKPYSIRRRVKSISADVLQFRSSILKFALFIALSFVFLAFSWTIKHAPIQDYKTEELENINIEIIPPRIKIIDKTPILKEDIKPKNPIIIADIDIETPIFVKPTLKQFEPTFTIPGKNIDKPKIITPAPPAPPIIDNAPPILLAEQMPRFPGCETIIGSQKEKKACADQKLIAYIYNNIKYPLIAKENRIEGTVVVRFTVNKKGEIVDVILMRDPGAGLGLSAMRLVESMNNLEALWTPGKQQGRPVSVLYTLPIKFKLK